MSGKLYIVPTPIGNLEDITLRAIRILKEVDLILAEDTRVSAKLLAYLEIKKSIKAYHQHNEHKNTQMVVNQLSQGSRIALISDAGTPAISDPGFLLIREALKENILIETLPGPTAFVPALVNSGLPCDRFIFEGFLPPKKGRKTKLTQIAQNQYTTILYESPHRILKTIHQLIEYVGEERPASFSRELTKLHEETVTGTMGYLKKKLEEKTSIKGEFVLIVSGI